MLNRTKALILVAFLSGTQANAQTVVVGVGKLTNKIKPTCAPSTSPPCFPTDTTASIFAAQNEFEAFEVAIYNGTSTALSNFAVGKPASLVGPAGAVLPNSNIWLYREAYYHVSIPSSPDYDSQIGDWPDALIPQVDEIYGQARAGSSGFSNFAPINPNDTCSGVPCNSIPPNTTRVILVDVLIPSGQAYGQYTATGSSGLQLTWTGGSQSVDVNVTVRNFALNVPGASCPTDGSVRDISCAPSSSSPLKTFYGLADTSICRAHFQDPTLCLNNQQSVSAPEGLDTKMGKLYARFLLDHGVSAAVALPPTYLQTGFGTTDWSKYETYYTPLFTGMSDTFDTGTPPTPFTDGHGHFASRLQGASLALVPFAWRHFDDTNPVASSNKDSDTHSQWWSEFVKLKISSKTFDKVCDEPSRDGTTATNCPPTTVPSGVSSVWNTIWTRSQNAKALAPSFPIMLTTDQANAQQGLQAVTSPTNANNYKIALTILAPVVNNVYDSNPNSAGASAPSGNHRPDYGDFLATSGQEFWWYQSCMSDGCNYPILSGTQAGTKAYNGYFKGWLSYMIDASPVKSRIQEWLSFRYGAKAEHYYESVGDLPTAWNRNIDAPNAQTISMPQAGGNGDGTLLYPGTPSLFSSFSPDPRRGGSCTSSADCPTGDSCIVLSGTTATCAIPFNSLPIGGTEDIPLASLRLKMIRGGLQDYQYLSRASDLGEPVLASTKVGEVLNYLTNGMDCLHGTTGLFTCPAPYGVSSAVALDTLYAKRKDLGDRIDQLSETFSVGLSPASVIPSPAGTSITLTASTQVSGPVADPLYWSLNSSPVLPVDPLDPSVTTRSGGPYTAPPSGSAGSFPITIGGRCPTPGTYNISVQGRNTKDGAAGTKTASSPAVAVTLNRPEFSMTCGSSSCALSGAPGTTVSLSVATALPTGYTSIPQTIVLSIGGTPPLGSGSFSNGVISPGQSSTLTYTIGASAPCGGGASAFYIHGASNLAQPPTPAAYCAMHDLPVSIAVTCPGPDFALRVNPTTVHAYAPNYSSFDPNFYSMANEGAFRYHPAAALATVFADSLNGSTQSVSLSASTFPGGSINLASTVTAGSSVTAACDASNSAPGTYYSTITGSATGSPNHTTTLTCVACVPNCPVAPCTQDPDTLWDVCPGFTCGQPDGCGGTCPPVDCVIDPNQSGWGFEGCVESFSRCLRLNRP
jgi:hypothetical protein